MCGCLSEQPCSEAEVAEQMTCVKITLSHPVTEHGISYFKTLFNQPAITGTYSGRDWNTAIYAGTF
jgi:hypothetical protein